MCIFLVLMQLFLSDHADVGFGGLEADVARGLVDEQVEEGRSKRRC